MIISEKIIWVAQLFTTQILAISVSRISRNYIIESISDVENLIYSSSPTAQPGDWIFFYRIY